MPVTTLHEPDVNLELARDHGLTDEEYQWVVDRLGRTPTFVELGIYSVMWSEHCSYKNSIALLKTLPREGEALLVEAGEEIVVESVRPFDVYQGKGLAEDEKSVAFQLVFRSMEKTLKDKQVNQLFNAIQSAVEDREDWRVRR